jgi:type II secretory pathway pseudopilin PulG
MTTFPRVSSWLAIAALTGALAAPAIAADTSKNVQNSQASQLRADMRKLWEDHITWTRMWLVSFAGGLQDQQAITARLMQNQVDIGNAIKPYYGDEAATKLTGLLKEHITDMVELVKASKAGDQAKIEAAKSKTYANGDAIASFLSGANAQNWPLDKMKAAMKGHLDTTVQEAQDRLGGKWDADIKDYDKVKEHILMLADTLTDGIVAQHAKHFTS